MNTRSQKLAQTAFARVSGRVGQGGKIDKEYVTVAKKFPALVHTCGLAQAVAFYLAKGHAKYLGDLVEVLCAGGHGEIATAEQLDERARTRPVGEYLRLSRDAIAAASWLKRYTEALEKPPCEALEST